MANSVVLDQTPHSVASDQGLHFFPRRVCQGKHSNLNCRPHFHHININFEHKFHFLLNSFEKKTEFYWLRCLIAYHISAIREEFSISNIKFDPKARPDMSEYRKHLIVNWSKEDISFRTRISKTTWMQGHIRGASPYLKFYYWDSKPHEIIAFSKVHHLTLKAPSKLVADDSLFIIFFFYYYFQRKLDVTLHVNRLQMSYLILKWKKKKKKKKKMLQLWFDILRVKSIILDRFTRE